MFSNLKNFIESEKGAITVDWVVLTAAIVSLAGIIMIAINGSTGNVGSGVSDYLSDYTVGGE